MNRYQQQVEEVVRAVEVLSPTTYAWLGSSQGNFHRLLEGR